MTDLHERRSCRLVGSSTAPTLGRSFVSVALTDWGVIDEFDEVALVTSELVTNAVCHVGGSVILAVAVDPDCIRIEVSDASKRRPVRGTPGSERAGGWGLNIIEHLATRWGSQLRPEGKVVWCELQRMSS